MQWLKAGVQQADSPGSNPGSFSYQVCDLEVLFKLSKPKFTHQGDGGKKSTALLVSFCSVITNILNFQWFTETHIYFCTHESADWL